MSEELQRNQIYETNAPKSTPASASDRKEGPRICRNCAFEAKDPAPCCPFCGSNFIGATDTLEEITQKAADDIFGMFGGVLHRIIDRIESDLTDGIGEECSSVKFEDVLDPIQNALQSAIAPLQAELEQAQDCINLNRPKWVKSGRQIEALQRENEELKKEVVDKCEEIRLLNEDLDILKAELEQAAKNELAAINAATAKEQA